MKNQIVSLVAGVIFAIGLGVGGMTQPQKVIGFLDFTGAWDPSLLFVMLGAVAVYTLAFRMASKRPQPLFSAKFYLPTRKDIDKRLVLGAVMFGVGWGLGGLCPGPALTSVASFTSSAGIFVLMMVIGMWLFARWDGYTERRDVSHDAETSATAVVPKLGKNDTLETPKIGTAGAPLRVNELKESTAT